MGVFLYSTDYVLVTYPTTNQGERRKQRLNEEGRGLYGTLLVCSTLRLNHARVKAPT